MRGCVSLAVQCPRRGVAGPGHHVQLPAVRLGGLLRRGRSGLPGVHHSVPGDMSRPARAIHRSGHRVQPAVLRQCRGGRGLLRHPRRVHRHRPGLLRPGRGAVPRRRDHMCADVLQPGAWRVLHAERLRAAHQHHLRRATRQRLPGRGNDLRGGLVRHALWRLLRRKRRMHRCHRRAVRKLAAVSGRRHHLRPEQPLRRGAMLPHHRRVRESRAHQLQRARRVRAWHPVRPVHQHLPPADRRLL